MSRRGFSLTEMLVALSILAVLAAGLLRFLAAGSAALARAVEGVELRRGLRRAMDQLSDDVQEAGFAVPCRAPPAGPPLWHPPGELVLIKDVVLPGQGVLRSPLPAGRVRLEAPTGARLRRGDLVLVEDGAWEGFVLEEPIDLPGEGAVTPLEGENARPHGEGAPVTFVRPLRRVAYRLEGGSLVRREGGPEGDPAHESVRILARHLVAFRVEGSGPGVAVTLEARGPAGTRCTLVLVRVPRNGEPS